MSGKRNLEGNKAAIANRMLRKVTSILEANQIHYWLEGGTLLGIIREKRLLPWDNDLDISIREVDLTRFLAIQYKLFFNGYRTRCIKYRLDSEPFKKGRIRLINIFNLYLSKKRKVVLDVFIKTKQNELYFWGIGGNPIVKKAVPACFYDQLDSVVYNNKAYFIPSNCQEYLTYRYGDWKIPKKDYNYKKDDKSIIGVFRHSG